MPDRTPCGWVWSSSASRHSFSGGISRLPSASPYRRRGRARRRACGHIVHAVVVNTSSGRPAGDPSSDRGLQCSTTIAPWACMIALGRPCRAGGEEHPHRMVERNLRELERLAARGRVSQPIAVGERVVRRRRGRGRERRARASAGRRGSRRPRPGGRAHLLAVAVAGYGEEDLRLEHPEAVGHAAGAELRRTASPTSRRGWRSRGTRRASRGCSAVADDAVPLPTPSSRRPTRAAATCSRSSVIESSIGPRVCERASTAIRSGPPRACSA